MRPTNPPGSILRADERVTDGARTRLLRSHNPQTPVSRGCRTLLDRLIYADFSARGCPPFLHVASSVVSEVVSNMALAWSVLPSSEGRQSPSTNISRRPILCRNLASFGHFGHLRCFRPVLVRSASRSTPTLLSVNPGPDGRRSPGQPRAGMRPLQP